ncbi:hypothetical protein CN150_32670 [Sinorhizobium meliloti]|nr:hypothetical protein CN150_32670 [Sinorhizobium meliloti]
MGQTINGLTFACPKRCHGQNAEAGARARRRYSPPLWAGESHLANKRLFCCGKSILGVLR